MSPDARVPLRAWPTRRRLSSRTSRGRAAPVCRRPVRRTSRGGQSRSQQLRADAGLLERGDAQAKAAELNSSRSTARSEYFVMPFEWLTPAPSSSSSPGPAFGMTPEPAIVAPPPMAVSASGHAEPSSSDGVCARARSREPDGDLRPPTCHRSAPMLRRRRHEHLGSRRRGAVPTGARQPDPRSTQAQRSPTCELPTPCRARLHQAAGRRTQSNRSCRARVRRQSERRYRSHRTDEQLGDSLLATQFTQRLRRHRSMIWIREAAEKRINIPRLASC